MKRSAGLLLIALALGSAVALPLLPSPAQARTAQLVAESRGAKLDINSASESELDALPGIGPALARKIAAGRPYRSKDELVRRHIIPESTYAEIKDRIVAHQQSGSSRPSAR